METQGSGLSISDQANIILKDLNDWALNEQGIAVVAENADEKVLSGYNNVVGPKCLIVFVGEEPYGPDDTQDVTARVMRHFDVAIYRGKVMSDPRNSALVNTTNNSKPFYDLVEGARDLIRCIEWPTPTCVNPTWYKGIRPLNSDKFLLDSYVISFGVIVQIGRIQVDPSVLSGNNPEYVQLTDPENIQFNKSL